MAISVQLFAMPPSPDDVLERLYQAVAKNIDQVVAEAVEKAIAAQCKETTQR